MPASTIFPAISRIRQRISDLAQAADRDSASIQLVAVTKTQEPSAMTELAKEGLMVYGENRAEHLKYMVEAATEEAIFHFIGRIQRRQYSKVVPNCACLHSFADPGHLPALVKACELRRTKSAQSAKPYQPLEVFCQVNTGIEAHKAGLSPEQLPPLIDDLREHADLLIPVGLMTMAPDLKLPESSAEDVRHCFATLRELAAELGLPRLSMGMSGDYDIAIAEGATDIRIGSALFQRD